MAEIGSVQIDAREMVRTRLTVQITLTNMQKVMLRVRVFRILLGVIAPLCPGKIEVNFVD